jgi:hypothetical protein
MAYHNHISQDLPLHHFADQSQHQHHHHHHHHQNQTLPDNTLLAVHSSPSDPNSKPGSDHHHHPLQTAPNWLNNALLRTPSQYNNSNSNSNSNNNNNNNNNNSNSNSNTNFLNLHTASDSTAASQSSNQWLSRPILHRNHSDVIDDVAGESIIAASMSHESSENMKNSENNNNQVLNPNKSEGMVMGMGMGVGVVVESGGDGVMNWQNARYKAEILSHPLYEQLLSAHVACLRIATPVDQLPRIDAQLAQSQNVVSKYSPLGHGTQAMVGDDKDLDQFMVCYYCRFLLQISFIHFLPFIFCGL